MREWGRSGWGGGRGSVGRTCIVYHGEAGVLMVVGDEKECVAAAGENFSSLLLCFIVKSGSVQRLRLLRQRCIPFHFECSSSQFSFRQQTKPFFFLRGDFDDHISWDLSACKCKTSTKFDKTFLVRAFPLLPF